jgi:hypothetical protein
MEEKPPTKNEFSAEAEHAPEPRHIEPAPIVAVAGVYFRRPVWKKDGSLVWQKFRGHPSRGAELISLTRSTIAFCDGEPLEVVQTVIARLPEAVLAKCTKASADPVEISRKIERHLSDEGLRSEMIDRRQACYEAHPDVESISESGLRGTSAELDSFVAAMDAVDQANLDLLCQDKWNKVPKKVLRAILRGLGYPKPENLTRRHEPWTIPKARPK